MLKQEENYSEPIEMVRKEEEKIRGRHIFTF